MLSSACRCWCLAWCSRDLLLVGWELWRVYQSVQQADSLLGWWWHWQTTSQVTPSLHSIQNISLWICRNSKASSASNADLESSAPLFGINAGAMKGQRKIYDGEVRPWFGSLTLSLILNEVEGYRAKLCTGLVYIRRITAEADRSNAIYWWNWMSTLYCVCDRFLWLSLRVSLLCKRQIKKLTLTRNDSRFVTCAWYSTGKTALKCHREFQHISVKNFKNNKGNLYVPEPWQVPVRVTGGCSSL